MAGCLMDYKIVSTMFFLSAGVILASFQFFYRGENTSGAGGLVLGLVMMVASVLLTWRYKAYINKLITEGWCVDADFESAEKCYRSKPARYLYNGRYYTIKCSWLDPAGTYHVFTDSIMLHFDPSVELTHRKTIMVYVDRNDPSKYYMDLDFLKELDKRRI